MVVFAASCTKPEEPVLSVSGKVGEHDYVDLGLPSGTLWATCNVGADSPEGYGDYYAWGEVYPKIHYIWDTYKFYNGEQITKYYRGDSLLELEPEDDVAAKLWRFGWEIPTKTQWEELDQNTTKNRTTLNGVDGMLFTALNGNTLFLPAAGIASSGTINEAVEQSFWGEYWSSSLVSDYGRSLAWAYVFSGDFYVRENLRYLGFSLRPVCSKKR